MSVYAVLNQKGGVGKTTLALNLAYEWASRGLRVLVVDVDKQAAATSTLIAHDLDPAALTLADVLADTGRSGRGAELLEAVRPADDQWAGIEVVAASLDLEDVWSSLKPGLVFRLRRALDDADAALRWDRVILDGPPDLGPGTVAACVAADAVVVPTRPERMSLHGVARTVETLAVVRRDMRPDVRLAGIVATAVDRRLVEHRTRVEEAREVYEDDVLDVVIPHRLLSDEASGAGVPAAAMTSAAAAEALGGAYSALATELDTRVAAWGVQL